jgi:hypothetical protein
MSRKTITKPNRLVWVAMHGGFLVWGVCLLVLAEEHRDGVESTVAIAEKPVRNGEQSAKSRAWVDAQIEALGDPLYGARAKATRRLMAAGAPVVERLSLALGSRDPEVARRSRHILEHIVRGNSDGFQAMEKIAGTLDHPAAKQAGAILNRELDRRERVMEALAANRQVDGHRLLREARAALYQGRFVEAREKAIAAQAMDITYKLFDDRPDLVLAAIHQAESRAPAPQPAVLVTAERE